MQLTLRTGTIVGWVLFGCLLAGAVTVAALVGVRDGLSLDGFAMPLLGVIYSLLGQLIVSRRAGNSVAWLFFTVSTWLVVTGFSVLALGDGSRPPDQPTTWHVLAILWSEAGYFPFLFVPIGLFFFLFPTGRFLTRRSAWVGCAGAVLTSLIPLDTVLQTEVGPSDAAWTIPSPFGVLEEHSSFLQGMTAVGLPLLVVGGVVAIITRYRRSDATVRSKIKWVVYGLGVMLASFFGSALIPEHAPAWIGDLLFVVVLFAIPVTVVMAITRHRLYDIDRLVSRTVGYGLVVSLLGIVYVAGAVWLPSRVIGEQSTIFVAASTLIASVLANPLRKRIMDQVDRRFNRRRYDAEQLVQQFGDLLGGRRELTGILDETAAIVTDVVQPASIGVWVKQGSAGSPQPATAPLRGRFGRTSA